MICRTRYMGGHTNPHLYVFLVINFYMFFFQVPIIIPYTVLLVSSYLVIAPIVDKPQWEYLYATGFIFGGLLVYVPFVKWGYSLPFMGM